MWEEKENYEAYLKKYNYVISTTLYKFVQTSNCHTGKMEIKTITKHAVYD